MDVGHPCCCHHLLHAHRPLIVPILNVLLDASVEEDRLLRHKAKLGPKLGHIERLNVVPLNRETAFVEVVQPLDELQDSRLATT